MALSPVIAVKEGWQQDAYSPKQQKLWCPRINRWNANSLWPDVLSLNTDTLPDTLTIKLKLPKNRFNVEMWFLFLFSPPCGTSSPIVLVGEWIPMQHLPAVLTFIIPLLSCPVCHALGCLGPSETVTETCHADVLLRDGGRCLLHPSVSVCLCTPAQPGFGSVKPLLFSPPLSRGTRRGSPPVHPP